MTPFKPHGKTKSSLSSFCGDSETVILDKYCLVHMSYWYSAESVGFCSCSHVLLLDGSVFTFSAIIFVDRF